MIRYPGIGVLTVSTTEMGRAAETAAADYMESLEYEIVTRNYRRAYCEIDIVAVKDGSVSFVEVKYRSSSRFGGGMEYITPQKLTRMQRGAETWVARSGWTGPYRLAAVEVSGKKLEVTGFIESLV